MGDKRTRAYIRRSLSTGQIVEALPPRAVCRSLLFKVRVMIVRLPCSRQPVAKHHFRDVWLGQRREIGARRLAKIVNRPMRHFVLLVSPQPLHDVVGQRQRRALAHRLVVLGIQKHMRMIAT
jgi:hypothetical protein